MGACQLAQSYTLDSDRWVLEPDVYDSDVPAVGFGALHYVQMKSAGQSRFNCETPLLLEQTLDAVDRQSAGLQSDTFRIFWRQLKSE
jgi:hypothetical protein